MQTKRIVTIGGGTGSFTLLQGLKRHPFRLSAVVSMADDGGSTGVLRDELGVLPPGDVRQCLVALSQSSEKMRELMNYRFDNGGLKGHSFGNLLLSALEKMEGSFSEGVRRAMEILKVCGEVIPVTNEDAHLEMRLSDGTMLCGENEINHAETLQEVGIEKFSFAKSVRASALAVKRIGEADAIVIGPGNFYCSLLPNVLIRTCARAIRDSSARVIFVANLTNKRGHTSGWSVDDFVRELEKYIGRGRVDFVVWNVRKPNKELVRKYEEQEGEGMLVTFDQDAILNRTYRVLRADVVSDRASVVREGDVIAATRAFIRHDSDRLAQAIAFLVTLDSKKRVIHDIV
ncbi:MAG: YvcK family protein [Candidatus Moraniibacteriota bacterium]|nr:MAG: YvcK family protein [Candidatus Moranbacteria bacterium]